MENRGFLHASRFETDPNLPHFRAITAQPHLFYLFLLSRRIETPSSFPVSTETDPAGTSNEANRSGHDSQPRVSALVTRSTKEKLTEEAQGNNGREGGAQGSGRVGERVPRPPWGPLASDRRPDTDQKNVCQRMRTGNVEEERGWIR